MQYGTVIQGTFLSRPNRFIAHVSVGGTAVVCHVKNTGRCRELLIPGAVVYLEQSDNPDRKTKYDLIAVEKKGILINMDAQAPNKVFAEWAGQFLPGLTAVRPEYTWEDSRFDFLLEDAAGPYLVEVKGVTLEEDGEVRFPDAPTERGVRHIKGLIRASEQGIRTALFFVVQLKGAKRFRPNDAAHPVFGETLRTAAAKGVGIFAYDCLVTPDSLQLDAPVPVMLT